MLDVCFVHTPPGSPLLAQDLWRC